MEISPQTSEPAIPVPGYCVHCRARRLMHGAIQVCNRRGGRDLKGHCGVCGKSMYRLGGWDAVAAAAQKAAASEAVSGVEHSDQVVP